MKLSLNPDGVMIDARDLGRLLGISPSEVQEKMRSGAITSRSEHGSDDDAGRVRLTFWYKDQRIRIICDQGGTVIKTTRITAHQKKTTPNSTSDSA